mgnify:CR=1 FL=1
MRKLGDTDVFKKTVALRVDLNVPVKDGKVLDDTRILSITSTLQYLKKQKQQDLEGSLYRFFSEKLSNPINQKNIRSEYPQASVHRRNSGYALDVLLDGFTDSELAGLNLSKLLTGSEGTLAFVTSITLSLDPTPPQEAVMVAAHYDSIEKCLRSVAPLMKHPLFTCEMMDKIILDCTKNNLTQAKNRFFLK